jgi:hypothetical protein
MAAFRLEQEISKNPYDQEEESKKKYKFGDISRKLKKKIDQKKREERECTSLYIEPTRPG